MPYALDPEGTLQLPCPDARKPFYEYTITPGKTIATKMCNGRALSTIARTHYDGNVIEAVRSDIDEDGKHVTIFESRRKDTPDWRHHIDKLPSTRVSIGHYWRGEPEQSLAGRLIQLSFHDPALWQCDHEEIARALGRQQTVVSSVHAPCIDACDDGFAAMLETARHAYGARLITLHPQHRERAQVLDALQRLQPALETLDMMLCYENLDADNRWFRDLHELLRLTAHLPHVGVTYDTCHAGGLDWELLANHPDKIKVVHLSNTTGKENHTPYNHGQIDPGAMLNTLENYFEGELVLDYGAKHLDDAVHDQQTLAKRFTRRRQ